MIIFSYLNHALEIEDFFRLRREVELHVLSANTLYHISSLVPRDEHASQKILTATTAGLKPGSPLLPSEKSQ
jgi:hypothetical protein